MIVPKIMALADPLCEKTFLGIKPWFHYLETTPHPECEITNLVILGSNSTLPFILLALIDGLLRLAGMIAVAFIIFGAVKFMTSDGNPDQAAKARDTIVGALIGLAIAIIAIAFVAFLGARLIR